MQHPVFNSPSNVNQKIWRYMELPKFVSLISTSSLHFAAADKMQDRFEGSYSLANLVRRKEWYSDIPSAHQERLSEFRRSVRGHVYLNCWHMADYESAAMWELYQAEGRGVAIRSTFKSLRDCMQSPQSIYIGTVKYVSYADDVIPESNAYYPFMHKRRSFEHERELRALMHDPNHMNQPGDPTTVFSNTVTVNLVKLIEAIYVAPATPDWYLNVVQTLVNKFELNLTVRRSVLDKDPVY